MSNITSSTTSTAMSSHDPNSEHFDAVAFDLSRSATAKVRHGRSCATSDCGDPCSESTGERAGSTPPNYEKYDIESDDDDASFFTEVRDLDGVEFKKQNSCNNVNQIKRLRVSRKSSFSISRNRLAHKDTKSINSVKNQPTPVSESHPEDSTSSQIFCSAFDNLMPMLGFKFTRRKQGEARS
mmetsp:Transcript_26342/g.40410  ORF Transcript_26342/g.40410 Transcript_26342/m.40410 type:complete len:182 (-) Transcript_26342:433-978(-)|eukprot:CAMPEP_0195285922 /NCGR_PEP_ID=MMETSP0707-20130614/3579_1 /TAXON_ID=33640 /ORGANISM="Asterionellopsis glacialis, Strain CCMP134" /LENGTH=181 /DNA_ID=CAMNT_0040345495 /DNA_START=54 /DNA_END=599 /DNA_ORIENTATION=+